MIIGRQEELRALKEAHESGYSEFVAVYGRRRIGKTFLVREAFDYQFTFQHAGLAKEGIRKQLVAFRDSLIEAGLTGFVTPKDWIEAFNGLKTLIRSSRKKKKVIFLDEVAWMDTPKSGFLSALENFWNSWASARKDVLLIICASATSWIIKKVFKNRGGLHNRVTFKIPLSPFTLKECEQYVQMKGLRLNRYQIVTLYMVMGGVALYWSLLDRRYSAVQNIDALFFNPKAKLKGEFDDLYDSLFKNPEPYREIIYALGKNNKGLTRLELINGGTVKDNGAITLKLNELEECGFIIKAPDFPKTKKNTIYKLVDNYTIFYFKYIRENEGVDGFWSSEGGGQSFRSWCGLAFERVCLQHIPQIKRALGFSAVASRQHAWRSDPAKLEPGEPGVQIDLLIDRNDSIINLCEMKWASDEYVIDKKYDAELRHKTDVFARQSGTRKAIHLTMVTTYGVKHNIYYDDIQSQVTMDQLFD